MIIRIERIKNLKKNYGKIFAIHSPHIIKKKKTILLIFQKQAEFSIYLPH